MSSSASTQQVPFNDLQRQYRAQQAQIEAAVQRVLRSGWYILGPELAAFEQEWAAYCGARHCVGVGNGTEALHLALRALDLPPGAEVITVANAGGYGAIAIRQAGLTPRFADVDEATHNLSPPALEAAITPRTRAILVVHLYGRPAPIEELLAVAERHGLPLIEDCAQAHGARVAGRMTGTFGRLGCFSFYPTKNLGALGDAGAIITDDDRLAAKLRRLRAYGWERKYYSLDPGGINSRLDEVQAAVLRAKLPQLERWNALRRERAAWYRRLLADVPGITLPDDLPGHVFHLFVIQVHGGQRDAVRQVLAARGIGSEVHYPMPTHLQPAFDELGYEAGELPVSERLAETVLSLPCFPELSYAEVETVCRALKEAIAALAA
ncbi:DegT/DnrJ/EryC1/StrS family aminotransferase [Kallotenue papyrolyticum]|uniref:DegT/DnrJ/EryC1/StrS family aminotransferase n=1 Tax=Kallotenue papyrolyticum TaxID=1325125 RepID=UPI0004785693|nr:DegT/DnrJ/EryC1/StrS family aminotransferase [Kallotenue papyrolyticum]